MTVKYYTSFNYTAKLTGQAGSIIPVLDIILLGSGWTKPFVGTNVAVYRNGAGSKQVYFRFDDTGSTTALTRNTKIRGYTTMTDATDTGTNPFPSMTNTQGWFIRKSSVATAVAQEWFAVVDELVCYLFIYSEGISTYPILYAFGDMQSDSPTDQYNSFVSVLSTDATAPPTGTNSFAGGGFVAISTVTSSGCAFAGTHDGVAGAKSYAKHLGMFSTALVSALASPEVVQGNYTPLVLSPIYLHYNNGTGTYVRGIHQGLWFIYNENTFIEESDFKDFYIKNTLTNKTFKSVKLSSTAYIFVEVSDTWYQ